MARGWAAAPALSIALATAAMAADQPLYAPAPAWVKPALIPSAPPGGDGAIQTLLQDNQTNFGAAETAFYNEMAWKVLTPLGLAAIGNLVEIWRPDTDTLTVHRLRIIRAGHVEDLLAEGKKFTVLRREANLESAMLDGTLTATIQPEGLQVGDVVDLAFTLVRRDPVLQGKSDSLVRLVHSGVAGRVRIRDIWPSTKKMRWRVTEGLNDPSITNTVQGTELTIDLPLAVTPKAPLRAPARFGRLAELSVSDFRNWAEVSALFAPLYAKAERLEPGSPLEAEIKRIKSATPDAESRAMAALSLVESQTRYFALAINLGGWIPATADETWRRRFGDCKGKTAVLLALLHGLGIEAAPALVSISGGDGLNERLPMADVFDHVLVRAMIAGKVYWLDGTRLGDRSLGDLTIPNYHWALPVMASGGKLEPLVPAPLTRPEREELVRIDDSAGLDKAAPAHLENIYRGDEAIAMRTLLSSLGRSDAERFVREFWASKYTWIEATKVGVDVDTPDGSTRLTMDGNAKMDWPIGPTGRQFDIGESSLGGDISYRREPGPHADAPFAVNHPSFEKRTVRIALPRAGVGFKLVAGDDIDATIGAVAYRRVSRIQDGIVTMEASQRSMAPEFPFSQAPVVAAALHRLSATDVVIAFDEATAEEMTDATPTDAAGFTARGAQRLSRGAYDLAIADFDQAARLEPKAAKHVYNRGVARFEKGDDKRALGDFNQALHLDPTDIQTLMARGELLILDGDTAGAKDFDQAEKLAPTDPRVLARRADTYRRAGNYAAAIADYDAWLKHYPDHKERTAMLAVRCMTTARWGRDLKVGLDDCAASLKLKPENAFALEGRAFIELRTGAFDAAVTDFNAALKVDAKAAAALYGRGVAELRKGQKTEGSADMAAAAVFDPDVAREFSAYGLRP
ncbi:MAG TPA: DUF3857 domain-containing protein [Caulobacteraceae bacterium]